MQQMVFLMAYSHNGYQENIHLKEGKIFHFAVDGLRKEIGGYF